MASSQLHQPQTYITKSWSLATLTAACQKSKQALQSKLRSLSSKSLPNILSNNSVRNFFLINTHEYVVKHPLLVESPSVGVRWGTNDIMLDMSQLTMEEKVEHLQAAATFLGTVYLVNVRLSAMEASIWWEALRLAQTTPKSLFFLFSFLDPCIESTFCVNKNGVYYPDAGSAFASEHLMDILTHNKGIKNLTIYRSDFEFLANGMFTTRVIESLHGLHLEHVVASHECVEALSSLHAPPSFKRLTLSSLRHYKYGPPSPWNKSLYRLLQWGLEELALVGFRMGTSEVMEFMKHLKISNNTSLYSLSLGKLSESSGLTASRAGENILNVGALVDALEQSGLPFFDLGTFPLDAAIEAQLLRNQQTRSNVLKQQLQRKVPATAMRLFICGDAYAGKTTLLSSLYSLCSKRRNIGLLGKLKLLMQKCFRPAIPNRTQGIEVRTIVKDGIQLSLWDMAGQQEFHAFHDYMFPDLSTTFGSPAMFMYVWNPIESKDGSKGEHKTMPAFEASFGYWLKFIASKTRQSSVSRKVILVFTRKDQMNHVSDALSASINAIASKFQPIIQVIEVFEVDARDRACLSPVASCIFNTARDVLEGVEVYHICTQVSEHLSLLFKASVSKQKLIINWSEFRDVCKGHFNINDNEVQKAIACSLHDSGDIIYMSNMGYLVLDPNWFCHEVMGSLIHFPESMTLKVLSRDGCAERQYLERLLEDVTKFRVNGSLLADLLEAMHLSCNIGNGTVFIPATFSDISSPGHHVQWRGQNTRLPSEYAYVGRRLECDKKEVTFLTPGLFPMIQVVFNKAFIEIEADVKLGKNFMSVCLRDMEIIVEFCLAKEEHVIDVMVRAPHQADMADDLAYVEEEVIRTLIRVCAQPVGIQGVKLVEGVLRPDCLHEPAASNVRENQCVSLNDLKQSLRRQLQEGRRPGRLVYLWKENQHVRSSTSSFIDLLGYEGYMEVLMLYKASLVEASRMATGDATNSEHATLRESKSGQRRERCKLDVGYGELDQNRTMMMVASPLHEQRRGSSRFTFDKEGEPMVDMFSRGMARAILEEINAKLDGLHSKMDSMHKDLQSGLNNMHKELVSLRSDVLPKIAKTVQQSLHFAVESEAGKIPRFVFLTTDRIGYTRTLVTSLFRGLHSARIELFCEHRSLPHRVEGQKGIVLTSINDTSLLHKALPYANGFLSLLTLVAKVGANVVAGAGCAVPDLSGIIDVGLEYDLSSLPDVDARKIPTLESFKEWQKCLVSVLQRHGGVSESNIAHKFSLRRALYIDTYQVAWLCESHYKEQRPFPLV